MCELREAVRSVAGASAAAGDRPATARAAVEPSARCSHTSGRALWPGRRTPAVRGLGRGPRAGVGSDRQMFALASTRGRRRRQISTERQMFALARWRWRLRRQTRPERREFATSRSAPAIPSVPFLATFAVPGSRGAADVRTSSLSLAGADSDAGRRCRSSRLCETDMRPKRPTRFAWSLRVREGCPVGDVPVRHVEGVSRGPSATDPRTRGTAEGSARRCRNASPTRASPPGVAAIPPGAGSATASTGTTVSRRTPSRPRREIARRQPPSRSSRPRPSAPRPRLPLPLHPPRRECR